MESKADSAPLRVLVTGCSSGIGRATAHTLAARGHAVLASARNPEDLEALPAALRLRLDVLDTASIASALDRAGHVDALVNNAAWSVSGPVEKVPIDAARKMFETNLFGPARIIQALVPQMRERQSGVIVNVSSLAGRVVPPLGGFYSASKFALEALSEALHFELSRFNIRVAIIEPGYVDTAFRDKAGRFGTDNAPYDELAKQWEGSDDKLVGGQRPGPEAVAEAIADAVEGRKNDLRWVVGSDAELVLGARQAMDDADFEAAMRKILDLDW